MLRAAWRRAPWDRNVLEVFRYVSGDRSILRLHKVVTAKLVLRRQCEVIHNNHGDASRSIAIRIESVSCCMAVGLNPETGLLRLRHLELEPASLLQAEARQSH